MQFQLILCKITHNYTTGLLISP